jgi:rod shape-determining protein MreB
MRPLDLNLFGTNSRQLAMDLGTANTVVYVPGEGVVLNEPSVIAVETVGGVDKVRTIGKDAKLLVGRTGDNIRTLRPLSDGVIKDLELAEQLIRNFIEKAIGGRQLLSRGPELAIGIPSSSTEVERRVIQAAALNAGAREVHLVAEPVAAALGAGLPVEEPVGSMIVDIGGGTTEVGIIACKQATYTVSERVGGDKMDEAIAAYIRSRYNLEIGIITAERIKHEIGSAVVTPEGRTIVEHVGGREVTTGALTEVEVSQAEIAEALSDVVQQIVTVVSGSLSYAGAEIASDIISHGLVFAGGGALLKEMDVALREATGLPVRVADDPLTCVAVGAARALADPQFRTELNAASGAI